MAELTHAPFHVSRPVGRLLLARWSHLRTVADAEAFRAAIFAGVGQGAPGVLICADWRSGHIVAPEVATVMVSMLSGSNPRLERSAILLPAEHATFDLQAERLIREAENPRRRAFRKVAEMVAWLGEVATPAELLAARTFLTTPA